MYGVIAMQAAPTAGPGLTTTLDIAALVGAIAALVSAVLWPFFLVTAALLFRDRLVEMAKLLAPRIKSLSIGGVSFEFTEARPLSLQMAGAVDLRHAGQSGDVNDSTLRSFYEQITEPSGLDYAVVDLGAGSEWLTSRLFILSVILARMRGLKALVFVETAGHIRRRFVGASECDKVRWRLAMRFPWLEAALAHAEASVWPVPLPPPASYPTSPLVSNEDGRLELLPGNPEPAANLLRSFLREIQGDATPALPAEEWVTLPGAASKIEHARWLTASDLEQIMGPALDQSSINLTELYCADEVCKARLFVSHTMRWVPLTREERVFDRLVDRLTIIEAVARKCVQSSGA